MKGNAQKKKKNQCYVFIFSGEGLNAPSGGLSMVARKKLLHFHGDPKPWKSQIVPYRQLYFQYAVGWHCSDKTNALEVVPGESMPFLPPCK